MIIYTNSNLFASPAQTLVNTVNLKGVMGKGIAKEFKYYYPQMFRKYARICKNHQFKIGQLMLSKDEHVFKHGLDTGKQRQRWVLNFPTKNDWRKPSRLSYLEKGLAKFVETYQKQGIESVAFPLLGVGCGHLAEADVKQLMESYLQKVDIPVYIHVYQPGKMRKVGSRDYYMQQNILENNLNTKHDAWRKCQVHDNQVNCDGIALPDSKLYQDRYSVLNVNTLPVSGFDLPELFWLRPNTKVIEGD